jgi:hypothetical protein
MKNKNVTTLVYIIGCIIGKLDDTPRVAAAYMFNNLKFSMQRK